MTHFQPTQMSKPVSVIGYVLAVSYPVLALSTGVRGLYQAFFKEGVTDMIPPALSGLAAILYLLATIGFAYRERWAWRLSVGVLGFETIVTLVIGAVSVVQPDLIGHNVWTRFGQDYGFFPLFQPLLGLVWLFWPATRQSYGIVAKEGKGTLN